MGQQFSAGTIERIRGAVASEPDLTRRALSRRVCDWLGWRGANGSPCEVSSRKALLELERRGLIALPPARQGPPLAREEPVAAWAAPAFQGDLSSLVAVEGDAQSALWRALLERYHPLGSGPLCGAQQRYLIRSPIGWLGGLAFSAAAWHLATPLDLGTAMRMVAKLGGFLGRKGDGHPGATVLWRGLEKLATITDTFRIFHPALPTGP